MNIDVKFTASSEGEDYDTRIQTIKRINTVVGLLRDNGHISTQITGMHDQKGELTVTWAKQPDGGEMEFLNELWREVSDEDVIHLVAG